MTCEHKRVIKLNGKTSDRCQTRVNHLGIDIVGYVPALEAFGGGDYLEIAVCLDCCVVVNMKPITDKEVLQALDLEDQDD